MYGRTLLRLALNDLVLKFSSYLRKLCLYPQQKTFTSTPIAEVLSSLPLPEEINLSLSAKPGVTSSEEDARHDNTYVSEGSPIVTCRPI